jgi:hypothetical protein
MDFITAITSVTKGIEVLKALQTIDKQFDAASYKVQIAELTAALADAKMALVDARDEVAERDKEIIRLKESFRQRREDTIVVRGMRYDKNPVDDKPMGVAYCSRCDTMDGVLIHLERVYAKDGSKSICPQCKAVFAPTATFQYPYPENQPSGPSRAG